MQSGSAPLICVYAQLGFIETFSPCSLFFIFFCGTRMDKGFKIFGRSLPGFWHFQGFASRFCIVCQNLLDCILKSCHLISKIYVANVIDEVNYNADMVYNNRFIWYIAVDVFMKFQMV